MAEIRKYLGAFKVVSQADGSVIVRGPMTSGNVDLEGQIIDPTWMKAEIPPWLADYGNIREQHRPDSAVGVGQSCDVDAEPGPELTAKIVDPEAVQKVNEKVYKGFSVGIKDPIIVADPRAPQGRIIGGRLIEVSIVDRPANPDCDFVIVRACGSSEWQDMQTNVFLQDMRRMAMPQPQPPVVKCRVCGKTAHTATLSVGTGGTETAYYCAAHAPKQQGASKMTQKRRQTFVRKDAEAEARAKRAEAEDEAEACSKEAEAEDEDEDSAKAAEAEDEAEDDDASSNTLPGLIPLPQTDDPEDSAGPGGGGAQDGFKSRYTAAMKKRFPAMSDDEAEAMFECLKEAEAEDEDEDEDEDSSKEDEAEDEDEDAAGGDGMSAPGMTPVPAPPGASGKPPFKPTHLLPVHIEPGKSKGSKKAAGDFDQVHPTPGTPSRSSRLGGVTGQIQDIAARLASLAEQTVDENGDIFPSDKRSGGKGPASDFTQVHPAPTTISPKPLELTFALKALTQSDEFRNLIRKEVRTAIAQSGVVNKAAETMKTAGDVGRMASQIAKGLGLLADQAEASSKDLTELKAKVERVEKAAAPAKGFARVDKGFLQNPDVYRTAIDKGDQAGVNSFVEQYLQLSESERLLAAADLAKALQRGG